MADPTTVQWFEAAVGFRKTRFSELHAAWLEQLDRIDFDKNTANRNSSLAEIRPKIEEFLSGTTDAENLRSEIDTCKRRESIFGFAGPAGAMFLNQVVKDGGPEASIVELRSAMSAPADLSDAATKIDAFAGYIKRCREPGSGAAIARVPFVLSWFWNAQEPDKWQPM